MKLPRILGVAEVGKELGWDKRKVSLYNERGKLPVPFQRIASGPLWTQEQIEKYKTMNKE